MKRRRHNDSDEDNDDAVLSQFVVLQIDIGAGSIVLGLPWTIYNARQNLMYDFTRGKNDFFKNI